jgi:class 3 adenylate cyclase
MTLLSISTVVTRIPFRHAFVFAILTTVVDIAFFAYSSVTSFVPVDATFIAFASVFFFRCALLTLVSLSEGASRADFTNRLALAAADADATALLRNLFPAAAVERLQVGVPVLPEVRHGVAVLYADMAGFTKMSSLLSSVELMGVLNTVYSRFDELVEDAGLWKVETVGDAYIVVGGIAAVDARTPGARDASIENYRTVSTPESARTLELARSKSLPADHDDATAPATAPRSPRENLESVLLLAGRMLKELEGFRARFDLPLHLRVGVHCGDVVTGVIGTARPRFCESFSGGTFE